MAVDPVVQIVFQDVLGRSSVPLLSVISGVLMVGYFRKPLKQVIWLRFQNLMIPLMSWGVLGLIAAYALGDIYSFTLNEIIPIWTTGPQGLHLDFLRDLFVLALTTPILLYLLKLTPLTLPLFVVIGFWVPIEPLLLRPQILPFYAFGLFLGLYAFSEPRLLSRFVPVLFTVAATMVLFGVDGDLFDDLFLRPTSAWTFWILAKSIARSILMPLFAWIEHAIFLLFLSHAIVGRILIGAYGKTGLELNTLFWLTVPFICLGIAIIGKRMLSHNLMPKWISLMLIGK